MRIQSRFLFAKPMLDYRGSVVGWIPPAWRKPSRTAIAAHRTLDPELMRKPPTGGGPQHQVHLITKGTNEARVQLGILLNYLHDTVLNPWSFKSAG